MSSHWPHWKVKSSLWALPVSNGGVYRKIHLVTFLYIFLWVDCFKWALIDCIEKRRVHSELWQFQNVRFTWWHFFISSYELTVSNEPLIDHKIHLVTFLYIFLLVDCFKWGLIDHKIHLVTFLYILLLVDCFKWALIDCIEKWRVHSELCWLQMGGYIVRFTWWHFLISSY